MDPSRTDSLADLGARPQDGRRGRLRGLHPRAGLLAAVVVLVFLVVLDCVLYAMLATSAEHVLSDAPQLAAAIKGQARVQLALLVLSSLLFLGGILGIGALESRRRAGAAAKLARSLGRIERGRYDTRIELRRDDQMQSVEDAFNRMAAALRDRTLHEVEALERLAERAGADDDDDASLGLELRELASRMRRAVE